MSQSNASQGAPLGDPDNAIDLALFGALGDLAMRKLFPALYHLDREGLMPESTRIMGLARQEHDVASFRQLVNDALQKRLKSGEQDKQSLERFLARLDYLQLDFSRVADLSHRPLFGQRDRTEPDRTAFCQPAIRYSVESEQHLPCGDHRSGKSGH